MKSLFSKSLKLILLTTLALQASSTVLAMEQNSKSPAEETSENDNNLLLSVSDEILQEILAQSISTDNKTPESVLTAIKKLIAQRKVCKRFNDFLRQPRNIANILHDAGINVNAVGVDGNTALHLAAANGSPEKVKILLDLGADVNAVGVDGNTALHRALKCGEMKMICFLPEGNKKCAEILVNHYRNHEIEISGDLKPILKELGIIKGSYCLIQ